MLVAVTLLAVLAGVVSIAAMRHRRSRGLGSVSASWITDHATAESHH